MTTAEPEKEVTAANKPSILRRVPWNSWIGVIFVLAVYYMSQVFGALALSIYTSLKHWSHAQAASWLNDSVYAQFVFILLAESFAIGAIYLFLKKYKLRFPAIGFNRPQWRYVLYGLVAVPAYYIIYLITVTIISWLIPGLNVNQSQDVGFNSVHGVLPLILTFVSLVVLPPLAEEIMVRGFLYSSLKKGLPQLAAALVTSLIFASAHLPEGGAAGPLYIAAIDTFILSLVLIFLREKSDSLWPGITLHAIKNGVAYFALFIAPLLSLHIR